MTDIAIAFNPATLSCDFALANGDLIMDEGLETAAVISLLTNRLAASDDEIPDGSGDRRGWWGDTPADGGTPAAQATDFIGARLWLLARAKETADTLNAARAYCLEALQWLVDDGVATRIDAVCQYQGSPSVGLMAAVVTVSRLSAAGQMVDHRFDLLWNATLSS